MAFVRILICNNLYYLWKRLIVSCHIWAFGLVSQSAFTVRGRIRLTIFRVINSTLSWAITGWSNYSTREHLFYDFIFFSQVFLNEAVTFLNNISKSMLTFRNFQVIFLLQIKWMMKTVKEVLPFWLSSFLKWGWMLYYRLFIGIQQMVTGNNNKV